MAHWQEWSYFETCVKTKKAVIFLALHSLSETVGFYLIFLAVQISFIIYVSCSSHD